jgi:hypothetical protein
VAIYFRAARIVPLSPAENYRSTVLYGRPFSQ